MSAFIVLVFNLYAPVGQVICSLKASRVQSYSRNGDATNLNKSDSMLTTFECVFFYLFKKKGVADRQ